MNTLSKSLLVMIIGVLVLSSCQKGDERLQDRTNLELETEKKFLAQWASEMEKDLEIRHRFFSALKGRFEGELKGGEETFKIRLNLVPSIPPFEADRIRTKEEVASDLLNLHFNSQILHWSPEESKYAVGCEFENVKPDLNNGQINLSSKGCSFYSLNIYDPGDKVSKNGGEVDIQSILDQSVNGKSKSLSAKVLSGEKTTIDELVGEMQPTANSEVFKFLIRRVK
jgi:hypothetical protein